MRMPAQAAGTCFRWAFPASRLSDFAPDMMGALSKVPYHWSAARLGRELSVAPLYITMWSCLWKDAVRNVPETLTLLQQHPDLCLQVVQEYKLQHGVSPCPVILMREVGTRLAYPLDL